MTDRLENNFYKKIVDQIHTNIYITDIESNKIVYMNDFMKRTFGVPDPEGKDCWEVLKRDSDRKYKMKRIRAHLENSEEKDCFWREYDPITGKTFMNYDVLQEWDGKKYHIQYCTDITENLQLTQDATIDELTHLLNRKAGKYQLAQTLKKLRDGEYLTIGLCDINGLKRINDTYGHQEGDRLLQYVATSMSCELKEPDFIFRLSGDEFIVVFVNKEISQAEQWMTQMLKNLCDKKMQMGIYYDASFSYGLISVLGEEHLGVSDILSLADAQMYVSKRDFHNEQEQKKESIPEEVDFYFIEDAFAENREEVEEQLLDFVNCNIPGGIIAVKDDEEFSIICFNQSMVEYSGGTLDEFLKQTDGKYYYFIYEADREKTVEEVKNQLAERDVYKVSYRIERKDGSIAWVYDVGRYAVDKDGNRLILSFIVDKTEEMEMEQELYHSKQLYSFIRNYTKLSVWEYFPMQDRINSQEEDVKKVYENVPDSILASKGVHPDSEKVFRELHEKIKCGADQAVGVIRLQFPKDVWKRVTYVSLKDSQGKVVSAVGIGEDVTAQREAEIRAFNQEKMREILSEDTLYTLHINLTTKRLEMAWNQTDGLQLDAVGDITYKEVYEKIYSAIANEDDRKRFEKEYNESKIYGDIQNDTKTKEFEFRQLNPDGRIIWVNLSYKIIVSPYTGNVILFIYARNIDMIKRKELSLQKKTELDEVTGLYNLATTRFMIESFLNDENRRMEEQAFILIDVDNFRNINQVGGFLVGDELLRQIGAVLQNISPSSSVTGRLNGDTFAVYLSKKENIQEEIKKIIEKTNGVYTCGKHQFVVTVSVGVICSGAHEMTCDYIYQNAHKALDMAKRSGGNTVIYYRELEEAERVLDRKKQSVSELYHQCLERIQKGESKKEICRTLMSYAEDIANEQNREMVMEMIQWVDYLYLLNGKYEQAMEVDRKTGLMNYETYMLHREEINEDAVITLGMIAVQVVNLKKYNQQYGNEKGDECLRFIADSLSNRFGWKNCYRIGRKTFLVICENMAYEQFEQQYVKMQEELSENYSDWVATSNAWEQTSIVVSKIQEQLEEKLRIARNKKLSTQTFSEQTLQEVLNNIRGKIAEGQFCTFLQPKSDAKTGKICGAEALVRMIDKEKGVIPPGRFLPAIEQAGLIRHIDLFVLSEVCRIMRQWIDHGWMPFPVSLNYSRVTILEPDILNETNRIVESYGISKELIEIEITESIGSIDSVSLKHIVDQFSESGYKIALDDYGAEYSNVYVLYSLKLNTLKLDRRVINDIYHDYKARRVVKNIIDMCKEFEIESVAEGVETKEHLEVLQGMACDKIQGYYLNKPLPEDEFYKQYIQ